jgi:hypothetical protein
MVPGTMRIKPFPSLGSRKRYLIAKALAGEHGERLEKAERDLRELTIGKLIGVSVGAVSAAVIRPAPAARGSAP